VAVAGQVIDRINRESLTTVAVDVPSAPLHGDKRRIWVAARSSTRPSTFFRAKPGHYSLAGLQHCGTLKVVDIGISRSVLEALARYFGLNAPTLWRQNLRRTDRGDHKYFTRPCHDLGFGAIATGACSGWTAQSRRVAPGRGWLPSRRRGQRWPSTRRPEPGNLIRPGARTARRSRVCSKTNGAIRSWSDPVQDVGERTRASALAALATRRSVVLDADAITVFAQQPASLFAAVAWGRFLLRLMKVSSSGCFQIWRASGAKSSAPDKRPGEAVQPCS